jgi:putative phage-type endonuclease
MLKNKKLKVSNIVPHTDEWHRYRLSGIGASEASVAYYGVNKYEGVVELYHRKIDNVQEFGKMRDHSDDALERMESGLWMEPTISDMWTYWDGARMSHISNKKNNMKIRDFVDSPGYVVNPEYPWLFASPDRVIPSGSASLVSEIDMLTDDCPLELKNVSFNGAKRWDGTVPKEYVIQMYQQMICMDCKYAEIARLIDGWDFMVIPIIRDDSFAESMIRVTKSFWYDLIMPAREFIARREECRVKGDVSGVEKWNTKIMELEPEPVSVADKKFISDTAEIEEGSDMGGDEIILRLAQQHKVIQRIIAELEKNSDVLEVKLSNMHRKFKIERFKFDDGSYTRYYRRANSINYMLDNRLKGDSLPPSEFVREQIKKIDLNFLK